MNMLDILSDSRLSFHWQLLKHQAAHRLSLGIKDFDSIEPCSTLTASHSFDILNGEIQNKLGNFFGARLQSLMTRRRMEI
jgi:hypothetical protein